MNEPAKSIPGRALLLTSDIDDLARMNAAPDIVGREVMAIALANGFTVSLIMSHDGFADIMIDRELCEPGEREEVARIFFNPQTGKIYTHRYYNRKAAQP